MTAERKNYFVNSLQDGPVWPSFGNRNTRAKLWPGTLRAGVSGGQIRKEQFRWKMRTVPSGTADTAAGSGRPERGSGTAKSECKGAGAGS
jgi:hypothetical protein